MVQTVGLAISNLTALSYVNDTELNNWLVIFFHGKKIQIFFRVIVIVFLEYSKEKKRIAFNKNIFKK